MRNGDKMKTIKAIFDFVDDLDVLLMFFVIASIDTINRISPYLAFVVMISTIIYGIVKTYSIIKNKGK